MNVITEDAHILLRSTCPRTPVIIDTAGINTKNSMTSSDMSAGVFWGISFGAMKNTPIVQIRFRTREIHVTRIVFLLIKGICDTPHFVVISKAIVWIETGSMNMREYCSKHRLYLYVDPNRESVDLLRE